VNMTICVDISVEEVESLVQHLETCDDDVMKGFIEQVLGNLSKHTAALNERNKAFEMVNPFSLAKIA